jgi:hypothetical protein
MTASENQHQENHAVLLVLFWAYVLIPLGWGVYQTFEKALALFA